MGMENIAEFALQGSQFGAVVCFGALAVFKLVGYHVTLNKLWSLWGWLRDMWCSCSTLSGSSSSNSHGTPTICAPSRLTFTQSKRDCLWIVGRRDIFTCFCHRIKFFYRSYRNAFIASGRLCWLKLRCWGGSGESRCHDEIVNISFSWLT